MSILSNIADLAGRILLAGIFLWSGYGKLLNPAGTAQYMKTGGVPGELVWGVIALELAGGLALVLGLLTRVSALGLAAFTLAAGILFHAKFGDMNQTIHFVKNLAIVGGLLTVAASGAGAWSLDRTFWGKKD